MAPGRRVHPLLYFLLFLPFSAPSGFVTVALGFLAPQRGISMIGISAMAAMTVLPQTYKFLWAPLIDVLWSLKRWYTAGVVASAATLVGIGLVPLRPENLGILETLIFINSVASSFVAMSVEAIMANTTDDTNRGRAAAWSQAGNLGGYALGGGLGLGLAQVLPQPWMAALVLAVALLPCCAALLPIAAPVHTTSGPDARRRLGELFTELWRVLWSRQSALALPLCFLPLGAGAAAGLFSAIASEWRASAWVVGVMNGWLSGVIMIAGCLAAGRLSDAMDRKAAYAVAGTLLALVALGFGLLPQSPTTYVLLCGAYSLATGLCYGTFTGFVLDVIGGGAAATKYNVFASLSNIPIWYMTRIDGWAADRFGALKMLLVDAAAGAVGLVVLAVVFAIVRTLRPAVPSVPASPVSSSRVS